MVELHFPVFENSIDFNQSEEGTKGLPARQEASVGSLQPQTRALKQQPIHSTVG